MQATVAQAILGKLVKDEDYRSAYLAKYLMSLIVGLWRGIVQERRNAEQMRNVVYQARCYHKAVWFSTVHGMLRIWTQAKDSAQWRVEHLFMPWVEIRYRVLMKEMVKWWYDMVEFEGSLVEWEDEEELAYWEATERRMRSRTVNGTIQGRAGGGPADLVV